MSLLVNLFICNLFSNKGLAQHVCGDLFTNGKLSSIKVKLSWVICPTMRRPSVTPVHYPN